MIKAKNTYFLKGKENRKDLSFAQCITNITKKNVLQSFQRKHILKMILYCY